MGVGTSRLYGRQDAVRSLAEALEGACEGRGTLVLVSGEAGIGKSRLGTELARLADARGVLAVFGRAFEAGGAPPFWPFVEALQAVLRKEPERYASVHPSRRRLLGQLVPELAEDAARQRPLSAEHARFLVLESVAGALCDLAAREPLVVVLEDVHAADADTLAALELLAAPIRGSRLLVLATARPIRATHGEHAAPLARIARAGMPIELHRLSREDAEAFLREAAGSALPAADREALVAAAEGHPLFLVEWARLYVARGSVGRPASLRDLPLGIRAVLGDRLATLSAVTRAVLEIGAVLGRELLEPTLAAVAEGEVEAAVDEAIAAAVLERSAPGILRFTHVLLRDVLHADIPEARRAMFHARAAGVLAESTRTEPPWAAIAHHLLHAGPAHREAAVEAARCAGERAGKDRAFAESARWFARALEVHAALPAIDASRHADLALALARAASLAGDLATAKAACEEALALARTLDDPRWLARAALERGRAFVFAAIDPDLVGALEEALDALGESEPGLRARLLARHAAATQPASDPSVPIGAARRAVALAREVGDERVLLETLRSATSAMADLGDPHERSRLNEELVTLCRRYGDPIDELRGGTRLSIDRFELGDVAGARTAIARAVVLADELDVPFVQWTASGLVVMRHAFEGALAMADDEAARARAFAESARDPNAMRCLGVQDVARLGLAGRFDEARRVLDGLHGVFADLDFAAPWLELIDSHLARWTSDPRPSLSTRAVAATLRTSDPGMLALLAEHAHDVGEPELAAELEARLSPRRGTFLAYGAIGLFIDAPFERYLALLALARGDHASARASFVAALDRCRATGARAHAAWIAHELAALLEALGEPEAASAHHALAGTLAAETGVRLAPPVLRTSARHAPRPASVASPHVEAPVSLLRDGELWILEVGEERHRLEDGKGIAYLARLLENPGRPMHVLELASDGPAEGIDRGDAGPLLDATAIRSYRARVATLREVIEEAESRGDDARALAARAELEALEDQLRAGLGLSGRARKSGSNVERARINVQRRLRDALRRIAAVSPAAGRTLERGLRTGTTCVFEP